MTTPSVIIAGIPVNTPANLAHAIRCDWPHDVPWPFPYVPGSIIMDCTECGGPMWVGPRACAAVASMPGALVMCLVCVTIVARTVYQDAPVIQLPVPVQGRHPW